MHQYDFITKGKLNASACCLDIFGKALDNMLVFGTYAIMAVLKKLLLFLQLGMDIL